MSPDEKRGRGRPPGSTNKPANKPATASVKPPDDPKAIEVRGVMKLIIHTPDYLGEFMDLMFAPENRKRLTDWSHEERTTAERRLVTVQTLDSLLTGATGARGAGA